jgi:HD-GYP domain-containing protein (c-di-GMP phosphodiesterase class II)
VDEDIKHIAVRHHEKLNGTGYHKHLNASEITVNDRILAIADIFSALCGVRNYKNAYPKEKSIAILEDMSAKNLIDAGIVELAVKHFDDILEAVNCEAEPVGQAYDAMNDEYLQVMEKVKKFKRKK